jgi:hypothetical protein
MQLGKSPLQKSFKVIVDKMEKIEKNISIILELEEEEIEFLKKKEKREKDRERKRKQNEKRFSLGLRNVLKGMKKKAEKKVKSFLDTLKELLIKGLLVTIVGAIVANWKTIEQWWNDTRQKIEDLINSFNEGVNDISEWFGGGTVIGQKDPSTNREDFEQALHDFLKKKFNRESDSGKVSYRRDGDKIVITFSDGTEQVIEKTSPDYGDINSIVTLLEGSTSGLNLGVLDTRSTIQKYTDLNRRKKEIEKELPETTDTTRKEELNRELQETVKNLGDIKNKIKDSKIKLSESTKSQLNIPDEIKELFETVPSTERKRSGGDIIMTPGGGNVFGKIKTGDTVPALLEHGEYVLNRKAVEHIGKNNLDALNFGTAPRFQAGGQVGNNRAMESNIPSLNRTQSASRNNNQQRQQSRPGGGNIIGYTGGVPGQRGSGSSTGPHVHLELGTGRKDGRPYDSNLPGKYILVNNRPISSYPVTSGYGMRGGRPHYGIDYGTPPNLPITLAGGAIFKGFDKTSNPGGYGYFAEAVDPSGRNWLMAHLSGDGNATPGEVSGNSDAQDSPGGSGESMMSSFTSGISGVLPAAGQFLQGFVQGFQESFGKGSPSTTPPNPSAPNTVSSLYSSGSVGTASGPIGDRIPAVLENGEYVLNRNAVKLIGKDNLDGINFGLASRFGDRGPSSQLMRQIGKGNYIGGNQTVPVIVNAPRQNPQVVASTVPQPNDNLLPNLPSFPPMRVMNTLAFRPMGTTYTPYA